MEDSWSLELENGRADSVEVEVLQRAQRVFEPLNARKVLLSCRMVVR